MNLRPAQLVCVLLLVGGQARAGVSAWDETQLQLLQQYSTPLRWDNVEGYPHWVSGPQPRHDFKQRRHFIHLQPGQEVLLRAAAGSWLRLVGETRTLRQEDLVIEISTDARMFIESTPINTLDPYSLLVGLPAGKPSLIRLARPRQAESNLVFAAYVSRVEPFGTLAPHRQTVHLPGKPVRLRRDGEAASKPAWILEPEESIQFPVKGPARLELVAWLPWPLSEPRREQSLVIQVIVDDTNAVPLRLSPKLDARRRTCVNGSVELVSDRMKGFCDVPQGKHLVRLQASAPVWLSVYRQSHSEFLLPRLNGPGANTMDLLPPAREESPRLPGIAFDPIAQPLSPGDLVRQEQEAWQLARDNQPMEAGAQAADWLNRLAETRQDYPAALNTAETLSHQRTIYREILPAQPTGRQPLREILFARNRILPLFDPERRTAVYNPTFEQIEGMLARGHFAVVPPRLSPGLLYELPARAYDCELRVTAMSSSSSRVHLWVQFDQEAPFGVVLDAATALPLEKLAVSDALATLRVLQQEVHLPTNVVLRPPVGDFDLPLPLGAPGVIELPLPQHVRRVRVHLQEAASPVLVSLAYRAGKPFELGEAGYRTLLNQVGSEEAMRLLAHAQDFPESAPQPLAELHNHLVPLARLLATHYNDFAKSIDLASLPPRTEHPLALEKASTLKSRARNLEREDRRIEATEVWNRIFWEGTTADQSEAALAILENLQLLGEEFLASQYARYVVLNSPRRQIPAPAVALLEHAARQTDDAGPLERLRAVLFLECPCPQHLSGLTEALALNGRDELALSAGLILRPSERPVESMLGAALHQNWWQTFDELVEELGENDAKCFWRAQKHLAFHQFVEAAHEFGESNERGQEMLEALQRGLRIREQLGALALSERLEALLAWEQWQSDLPGPKIWRSPQGLLQECFATDLLFNCEQDRFSTYLRTERGKPVRLRFLGPLRLQVEVRPVLDVPFNKPVNDWIEVTEYGITNRIPVSHCVPNPSLRFANSRSALVGVKTIATLEWGPGWHEVDVELTDHPGLVRVQQEQPVLPIRILPALTPDRMNLVLRDHQESSPAQDRGRTGTQRNLWWVPSGLARPGSLDQAIPQTAGDVADQATGAFTGLTEFERLRLALRREFDPSHPLEYDSRLFQELPPSEQWLAACRGKRWNDFTNWMALPDSTRASGWLATGRVQKIFDSEFSSDALQRLITLLEVSEFFPTWREQAQCLAEFLAAGTNCPPGGQKILLRLTDDRAWVPLTISPLSAGIRPLEVRSDLPQNPLTRLRRALLPPATTNQFTISGQSAFTASMDLQQPARVQLNTELVKAGFSPLTRLHVSLQVDDLEVQELSLVPPEATAETDFQLSEGPHLVRVWIADPVVNQFVRVTLSGSSGELTNALWSQSLAEVAGERRFFHAATPEQPVRFSWEGPALLRVDEDREGNFVSQLRLVQSGQQTVEIPSAPGHTESWYQIFVRSTRTNQPETRVASTLREPEEVPPPKLRLPESVAPSEAQLTDHYRLGGQEEGTWTPEVALVRRRPFEISDMQASVENEFVEANVQYRKVTPSETVWFRTEAMGRVHRPGDLTFGLSERVEGHPKDSPFDWSWRGEAFVGTVGPQQEDIQWALHTELELGERFHLNRKVDWYPSAGVFARYLSIDPDDASQYDYIDQDLFTTFRYEQRWGGVLGSRLEYRPWLDTLLKGGVYLMSNEDFTPDNWGMRLSWAQLMGPFRGEAAYRFRHFLQDPDRPSESWLQGVSAGLYVEHWISGRHRIELGAQFSHDWPDSGNSCFLVLRCDFSQGRGYKDYSPHETVFRDLRSRRIAGDFNNRLQPETPGPDRQ